MMTGLHRLVLAGFGALAAAVAAPALAAYICHPDPAGTRRLTLAGPAGRYLLDGPRVAVAVHTRTGCNVVSWNTLTGAHQTTGASCLSLLGRNLSAPAGLRVTVAPATALRPETLDVFRGTQRIAAWPLPARPRALDAAAGFALFTAGDGGTYALRLRDGRVAALGAAVPGDMPQIGEVGAVFAERSTYKTTTRNKLEFVPRSGIESEVRRDARPLRTGGAIRSLSMDGPRLALAVRDRGGRCDRVLYWNVLRAPVQRISAPVGPTCVPGRATGISAVAIGGFRAEWLAETGKQAAVVVGSPRCQEWVVRRLAHGVGGERVVAMAADGRTLAFGVTEQQRELRGLASVDVVSGKFSPRTILTGRVQHVGLAVAGNLVATALADGTVDVRTAQGRHVATLHTGHVDAIALDAGKLVALRPARLAVYDLASASRERTIPIPRATANRLDVQYGIAVLAAGRQAIAVDLTTGREAVVGSGASSLLGVAIERPGVAFASTGTRGGLARFVPLARVQSLLGRR
jgi:hypothetical protein